MSDKQRAEFEKWFKENHTQNVQKINGKYVHGSTERLRQAWQAALSSVVVELPESYGIGEFHLPAMLKALDEAGIRYE